MVVVGDLVVVVVVVVGEVVEVAVEVEAGEAVEPDWHVLVGLKVTKPGWFWPVLFVIQI